ncbi:MAG: nucleoside triphosphate pyrophosphohydrolase family protein [Saprospiraceae bacterium]|nr:nucleoside triphosphate pyrophosphohydrolase family protein [Saprospiraceae bacterium]
MKKFDEPRPLNDVADFHELFDLPVKNSPLIPSKERCELRISLLEEELEELKEAIEDGDLVEVADAFCDLQYVLSGAILEFGLGEKFKMLFEEVQRSNMSKACSSMEIARQTAEWYKANKGQEAHIVQKNGQYLVYRNTDGKVLKSVEYSPADIKTRL